MSVMRFMGPLMAATLLAFAIAGCKKEDVDSNKEDVQDVEDNEEYTPAGIPESRPLEISDICMLNRGTPVENSHAGATGRSSLMKNFRQQHLIPASIHGDDGKTKIVYPRMTRTQDGSLLIFHHREEGDAGTNYAGNRTLAIKASPDLSTFTSYGIVNEPFDNKISNNYLAFTDCFPLRLKDGNILTVCSQRTVLNYLTNTSHAGLVFRTWDAFAGKWLRDNRLVQGGFNLNWEPFMFQRANGDIHCYFTYVTPISGWTGVTNNSGTALIISHDGGATWTDAQIISRSQRDWNSDLSLGYFSDQMPSVIELNGTHKLVGAFETATAAAGASDSNFHITFSYADKDGGTQWTALEENTSGPADKQEALFKGCAPFLVQFPSGETVVSYNQSGTSGLYARMGDETARTFGDEITLIDKPAGFWGSLYVDNPHCLLAAVGGTTNGLHLGTFVLNHDIAASKRSIALDGSADEWDCTDDAIFVGARSQAQATLRCSADERKLYLLAEVLDENISENDYLTVYLTGTSQLRIRFSVAGLRDICKADGGWQPLDLSGIRVRTALDGTVDNASDADHGWRAEIALDRSLLDMAELRLNFSLYDDALGDEESVSDTYVMLSLSRCIGVGFAEPGGNVHYEF